MRCRKFEYTGTQLYWKCRRVPQAKPSWIEVDNAIFMQWSHWCAFGFELETFSWEVYAIDEKPCIVFTTTVLFTRSFKLSKWTYTRTFWYNVESFQFSEVSLHSDFEQSCIYTRRKLYKFISRHIGLSI